MMMIILLEPHKKATRGSDEVAISFFVLRFMTMLAVMKQVHSSLFLKNNVTACFFSKNLKFGSIWEEIICPLFNKLTTSISCLLRASNKICTNFHKLRVILEKSMTSKITSLTCKSFKGFEDIHVQC